MAFCLLLLISLSAVSLPSTTSAATIGVTYSTSGSISGSAMLSPDGIAAKVVSMEIPAVRLLDAEPSTIHAFGETNTSLFLSVPNPMVPHFASDRSFARRWVLLHIHPFINRTKIATISVGNSTISSSPDVSPFILRALKNLHRSLAELGISQVSISTTFTFSEVIESTIEPSSARFRQPVGDTIIRPILDFLEETKSCFIVNLYPKDFFRSSSTVPLEFALFPADFMEDSLTGVKYRNNFDMMINAVVSALTDMGQHNLPVIVAEMASRSSRETVEGILKLTDARVSQVFFTGFGAKKSSSIWMLISDDWLLFVCVFLVVASTANFIFFLCFQLKIGPSTSFLRHRARREERRAMEAANQEVQRQSWGALRRRIRKRV